MADEREPFLDSGLTNSGRMKENSFCEARGFPGVASLTSAAYEEAHVSVYGLSERSSLRKTAAKPLKFSSLNRST
jgi:hypothetical protein